MKSVITAICLLIPLVIIFFIIDRKDFYSGDDVAVQQETITGRKSTTATTLKPVEKLAETKAVAETKPVAETKAVETKFVAEAKPITEKKSAEIKLNTAKPAEAKPIEIKLVETKSAETKFVAETKLAEVDPAGTSLAEVKSTETHLGTKTKNATETKPEESAKPTAVPVVTKEESEKINAIALVSLKQFRDKRMKEEEKKAQLLSKAKCIHADDFLKKRYIGDSMQGETDSLVVAKGYNLSEFRKRVISSSFDLDYTTLPQETSFGINSGFHVISPQDLVRFYGISGMFQSMNRSLFFEVEIRNNSSDSDCRVDLGVFGYGNKKSGHSTFYSNYIPANETTILKWDTNPHDQYYLIKPTVSIFGDATIKEFRVYEYIHPEITVVEGTIKDRSQLPDPKLTDYPDCSYTAHFVGNAIFAGIPCNKEVELTIDGFINKKIQGFNGLKKGDCIKCAIVSFDEIPEGKSSGTQVADDLSLFELDGYYLVSYQKIDIFSDPQELLSDVIEFADSEKTKKTYVSIFNNVFNAKMDEEVKKAKNDRIASDLRHINEMLSPYTTERKQELNKRFQDAWTKEKQKDSPGYNRVRDLLNGIPVNIVWRNMDNAFYALPEEYIFIKEVNPNPISQTNIDALVAFKEYLELQGIRFIVSLVPNYYEIAARVINKDFASVPDFGTAYIVKQFLENGIETIYASDEIIRNYNKYPIPFLYPNNSHPGDLPQDILSSMVAERISRFRFTRTLDGKDFSVDLADIGMGTWGSMVFPPNCDIGNNPVGGHYNYINVLYQGKKPINNQNSPILLLGNSFSYSPSDQTMMSFLAMKTGIEIHQSTVGYYGPFTTLIQRIFNNPEYYLKGKKVVVFQVGSDQLLTNPSILNIKRLDNSVRISRNGSLIKTLDLSSDELIVPQFARGLSNPTIFKIGSDKKTTIYETNNLLGYEEKNSLSSKGKYYVEITYCSQELDKLELAINSNIYHLIGGNYTFLWIKDVFPVSVESNDLRIEVRGEPGKFIAVAAIKIYQIEE